MATPRCMRLMVYDNIGTVCSEKMIYLPMCVDEPVLYRVSLSALPVEVQHIFRYSTNNFYDTWSKLDDLISNKCSSLIDRNVYFLCLMNKILNAASLA